MKFLADMGISPLIVKRLKPTFISPTDEVHPKSGLKSDAIKKKNKYELDQVRMKRIFAIAIAIVPLFS